MRPPKTFFIALDAFDSALGFKVARLRAQREVTDAYYAEKQRKAEIALESFRLRSISDATKLPAMHDTFDAHDCKDAG